jgi:hypothetical protein
MAIAIPIPMPTVAFPAALSGSPTGFAGGYLLLKLLRTVLHSKGISRAGQLWCFWK